jgi:FixJ family two-component response regulator
MGSNETSSKPSTASGGAGEEEAVAKGRFARLTPRERQVVTMIVAGRTTKEIARDLRVSPRTIDAHRSHIMSKMGTRRVTELVRLAVLYLDQSEA